MTTDTNTNTEPDTVLQNLTEDQNAEYLETQDEKVKGLYESLNAVQGVVNKERKQNRTMGTEIQELKNVISTPNSWEQQLSSFGETPEKVLELLSAKDENAFKEMQTQIEKVKTTEREKYENEITEIKKENEQYKRREIDTFISNTAKEAISKHQGNVEALLPHVAKNISVQRVNGELEAVVLDNLGQVDHTQDVNSLIRNLQKHQSFQPLFASQSKKFNGEDKGLNNAPFQSNIKTGQSVAEQILTNIKASR